MKNTIAEYIKQDEEYRKMNTRKMNVYTIHGEIYTEDRESESGGGMIYGKRVGFIVSGKDKVYTRWTPEQIDEYLTSY